VLARGAAKNQKAAQAAADRDHIVGFGHEVNENVAQPSASHSFPRWSRNTLGQVGENQKKRFVLHFGLLSPSQPIG
jgi:hypothetical protein